MSSPLPLTPSATTHQKSINDLLPELRATVGAEHLRAATDHDRIDGVQPKFVVEPASAEEFAQILRLCDDAQIGVVPRGSGSKLAWGNQPARADLVLSTRRLDRILEHAWGDMTATVEAGCTIAKLQGVLAQHGQRLALDPLWPEQATVGGVLSANDSGSLRVRFGALRDLIIGVTLALPDGTLAKSGGKVVKNVAGYDLPKLVTGSLGTLGVITQAIFRLHPLPRMERSVTLSADSTSVLNKLLLAIHDSQLAFTGLQLRAGNGKPSGVDIRFDGTDVGIEAQRGHLATIAGDLKASEAVPDIWAARERLFSSDQAAAILKFSVLPSELHVFSELLRTTVATSDSHWDLVAQSFGVGLLRLKSGNAAQLAEFIAALRRGIKSLGGTNLFGTSDASLAVLSCPGETKSKLDVWGATSDAQALFVKVKHQFDPAGILNRGRFIGGI